MSIPQMSLSIPTPSRNLSAIRVLTCPYQLNLLPKFSQLSIHTISITPITRTTTIIRNGGGPRTYPGGVSKWQWKRMQAKKAKQLLKARLCRERQIYEMRKRAELRAAVSELERPWEVVEKAPTLFSVRADEQLKVLADRFQRPGGYDLWSENDGPQLFQTVDGLPSARFFPKGVVHSIKPYQSVRDLGNSDDSVDFKEFNLQDSTVEGRGNNGYRRRSRKFSNRRGRGASDSEGENVDSDRSSIRDNQVGNGKKSYSKKFGFLGKVEEREGLGNVDGRKISRDFNGGRVENGSRRNGTRGNLGSGVSDGLNSKKAGRKEILFRSSSSDSRYNTRKGSSSRTNDLETGEVYDMSLKHDGTYEFH